MRILLHCVYFPPEVGGLESHVHTLAAALVRRGHEVEVVTSKSQPGLAREEEMEGIRVRRTMLPSRSSWGWGAHALGSIPATVRGARRADLLHAQAFGSVLPCGVARARTGRPMVATFHTSHFLTRAEKARWRPVLARLVRAPDYRLAASEEIAEVAEALAPGCAVEALTNGVDTDVFRPVPPASPRGEGRRVVVPRRLFSKNGVEYFVRAMPRIVEALGEEAIQALVVGDGPEGPRLRALAAELGVGERIRFLGARPNAEMPGLLCSAELAVFPSLMEATSVAALEAMACGLPVAASRVGGLPEIVDEEVGGLFEPADPDSLAETVTGLLRGGELPRLGLRARERVVKRWSLGRLVDRHLEIYRALIEEKGESGGIG